MWSPQACPVLAISVGRAYHECGLCGLGDDEIATMIENIRRRGLTREEELELLDSTFGPGDEKEEDEGAEN